MKQVYFWKDGKVMQLVAPVYLSNAKTAKVFNLFCVDDYEIDPELRYGRFLNTGWEHIPLNDLPKEFLLTLLILGVKP